MESHLQGIVIVAAALVVMCNGPAWIARAIGTIVALLIVARCRRHADALIARRCERAAWNRPSRADRQLLSASLDAAVAEARFSSLLPQCVLDAHRLEAGIDAIRR